MSGGAGRWIAALAAGGLAGLALAVGGAAIVGLYLAFASHDHSGFAFVLELLFTIFASFWQALVLGCAGAALGASVGFAYASVQHQLNLGLTTDLLVAAGAAGIAALLLPLAIFDVGHTLASVLPHNRGWLFTLVAVAGVLAVLFYWVLTVQPMTLRLRDPRVG